MVGLAVAISMWYRTDRALQNAADAAVIASALNSSGSYQSEAKAVAAQYGFVDGASGITVTVLNNQTCPDGTTSCYQVTVAQASAPTYFSQILGNVSPTLSKCSDGKRRANAFLLPARARQQRHRSGYPDEWCTQ